MNFVSKVLKPISCPLQIKSYALFFGKSCIVVHSLEVTGNISLLLVKEK